METLNSPQRSKGHTTMKSSFALLTIIWALAGPPQAEPILEFTLAPSEDLINQPVSIDLSGNDYNRDTGDLILYRVDGNNRIVVPSQLENGVSPKLWFLPGRVVPGGEKAHFEIVKLPGTGPENVVTAGTDRDHITIYAGDREVLEYRHSMIEAPEGINPLYRRKGAYIHPLRSPEGKVLTNVQPADHYHHYGIWNPWTRTVFEGRSVDFWNLAEGQGTVRNAGILSTYSGQLFAGFRVYHEHVDFSAPVAEKTALNETWDVRVWMPEIDGRPAWLIDCTFLINCATDSTVVLSQYRYGGGIGFRATREWTKDNSTVLTSEGRTRQDADASFARWCMLEGATGPGMRSGIVFMSHPANRSHPEPMRVWPEDANAGRGDLFFEFCPVRHQEWILHPGREYVLKYRMVVFDDKLDTDLIDQLWRNYAFPPRIEY